jgi:RND superfamily putative drug exporter
MATPNPATDTQLTGPDRFFQRLARVVVRYRFLVVALWLVAVVVTARLPSLSSEINNDNSQFLPASTPSSKAANLATPILGSFTDSSNVTIVGATTTGRPIDATDIGALRSLASTVRGIAHVTSVRELAVSADGQAVQILVRSRINFADIARQKTLIDSIEAAIARAHSPGGFELRVAGPVATNVANQVQSQKTGSETQTFSLVFIVVLLFLIFRSALAPILTLLPAGLSLLVATRVIGELGAHGLKISEITELLLIILVLGAGTDYGLFLVFRVREEIRRGYGGHEAVERAIVRVGESITASAGTVIIALLSLLLASFGIYHDLGIPLAIGIVVILLAGLTLLPALLAIFGRAAFWPTKPKPGEARDGWWGKVAARLIRRPGLTLAAGVILFAALALGALNYHSGGFGGAAGAPGGSNAAKGNALVAAHFPASSANPANLVFQLPGPAGADAVAIKAAEASLVASRRFTGLLGPLDPNGTRLSPALYTRLYAKLGPPQSLGETEPAGAGIPAALYNAYHASGAFLGGRVFQFEVTLVAGGQQTTAALNATPTIRRVVATAARAAGADASGVAGEASALYDVSTTSDHDLVNIIPVAIFAIAILLALVLRSLIAPLYLIVSVAFSYLAALGVATIVFIDLSGDSGLTFILPFLMFIFLLALGEDYNILVMTRIREEARSYPLREAVVRAVGRTGSTVTSAGLVLAGTFGVLAIVAGDSASGSQVRAIGFGLAIGILMDTFVVRTLLVPATATLLGRWNWWPAKMSRQSADLPTGQPAARQ